MDVAAVIEEVYPIIFCFLLTIVEEKILLWVTIIFFYI